MSSELKPIAKERIRGASFDALVETMLTHASVPTFFATFRALALGLELRWLSDVAARVVTGR